MQGFEGSDVRDFEFAAGKVTGYRWWCLIAPEFDLSPVTGTGKWPIGWLRGQQGVPWGSGENSAHCLYNDLHKPPFQTGSGILGQRCGCGFWAYWEPQTEPHFTIDSLSILGVIEGYGRTLIGPKGFRCEKARIVALHLASPIELVIPASSDRAAAWRDAFTVPGVHRLPGGRIPILEPIKVSDEVIEEANDRRLAWTAAIEDRLAQLYPESEVCVTRSKLLTSYPASKEYAPPGPGLTGG